jgi:hypothetical protein
VVKKVGDLGVGKDESFVKVDVKPYDSGVGTDKITIEKKEPKPTTEK